MKGLRWCSVILVLLAAKAPAQTVEMTASSCAALAKLALPNTWITKAEQVEAGTFPPQGTIQPTPQELQKYKDFPTFCRVVAEIKPSADSDIKIELWLPAKTWNGKFQGQGNGGFAGRIDYSGLALAVSHGYASAGTDTGHSGTPNDATWALNHPEKIIDYGWRGVHEMTLKSKTIMEAYYGTLPRRSYFLSCSNGGREALMEAQRFPADYDGILAGDPAYNWTHMLANAVANEQALTSRSTSYISKAKLRTISAAVLSTCDAKDGVVDGLLTDPRRCNFDPSVLLCKDGDADSCLTSAQIIALKALYDGAHDSSGKLVFPGYVPGAERDPNGWGLWITGAAPGKSGMFGFGEGYFADFVYNKPDWNYKTFTVDDGLRMAVKTTGKAVDATNPNLKAFGARGGKLIIYHGWNDPAISPLSSIDYYNEVIHAVGKQKTQSFVRLFMVPGMVHCAAGPGPDSFGQPGWHPDEGPRDSQHDIRLALEQWVEQGAAPEKLIATKYVGPESRVTMTRPLCAYPQAPEYKGSGDTSDAANFVCAAGLK